ILYWLIVLMDKETKVAIVTGASRGIGACLAEGLAEDGYALVMVARTKDALEKVAGRIRKNATAFSPPVITYEADVQDHAIVQNIVAEIISKFGRIDLLINNAGLGGAGDLNLSIEDFDRHFAVNLRGPFNFLKAAVPHMKAQRSGTIINIASRS